MNSQPLKTSAPRPPAPSPLAPPAVQKATTPPSSSFRSPYFFLLIFTLLSLSLGLFFFHRLSGAVFEKRKKISLLQLENQRLSRLPQELKSWETEISLVDEFFPKEKDVVAFYNFLEKISPSGQVNFSFENRPVAIDTSGRPFLSFTLVTQGNFEKEISPFLISLFQGTYFIFPEKFSFESTDHIFQNSQLHLSGRIYVDQDFLNQ